MFNTRPVTHFFPLVISFHVCLPELAGIHLNSAALYSAPSFHCLFLSTLLHSKSLCDGMISLNDAFGYTLTYICKCLKCGPVV